MKTKIIIFLSTFALFFTPSFVFALTLDATGGTCTTVGTWNPASLTCTLTQDFNDTITITADNVTVDGAGHTITGTAAATGVYAQGTNITVKNLTLSGFGTGMFLASLGYSRVEGNTIQTGGRTSDIGLLLGGNNTYQTTVQNNTITGGGMAGIYSNDADSDIFLGNTVKNFQIGLRFEYCSGDHIFKGNTIEGNTLGAYFSGASGTFSRNNFKNNTRDIQNALTGCGYGTETLSKSLPDGGNYWSSNITCADANHDNICDSAYAPATTTNNATNLPVTLFDNFPWAQENGWNLPTTSPIILSNPTETEDDGNQDTKGVADKTNFTFSVTASGAPDTVNLVVGSSTIPLAKNGDAYTATSTFPKGHYTYHFEASAGGQITKTADQVFTTGYSNVAFLPGLEASRLYRPEILSGMDEDQLWEPNIKSDVQELYLDGNGKSTDTNIYTRDSIDEFNILPIGQGNVYKSFINQMRELKSSHAINDWEAIPYDWRLSLDDILTSGKKIGEHGGISDISYTDATSSPFVVQEIERLAQNSDTGKVTIIAHSNGGLLTKRLTKKLEEKGEGNIADKIIFVAVPQSGTPEAIGALLNGFNQNHFPVLDTETARTFAENMPSAYNLLPSESYFNGEGSGVKTSPVEFLPGSQTALFRNMYGNEIGNFDTLQAFLRGMEGRIKPESSNVTYPNVLNPDLLTAAYNTHTALDSWTPPPGVKVYQIAGWGVKTLETIKYKQGSYFHCLGLSPCISYDTALTADGDGTVVVPSALAMSTSSPEVTRYLVNMRNYNDSHFVTSFIGLEHKDILEVENLRDFIGDLITNTDKPLSDYAYLSTVTPPSSGDKKLSYFLHSPLSLDLYDDAGNHTGISTTTGALENGIPGAYYREFGEVKYVTAPASTTIHLVLNGQATGYFTLDIQETIGDAIMATTTFEDIPSATSTRVAMDFTDGTISGAGNLHVDENGDGATDFSLAPKLNSIVTLPKPTLTITADNKIITLGLLIPPLTATLSPISNDVTGTPNCTTTAATSNSVGTYPITCTIGTLASNTYNFAFATGTLSIFYRFDGFLQPINDITYHPTQAPSVFKGGSTVPIKFQIKNSNGMPVQANTLPTFSFQKGNTMSASVDESTYSDPATTGSAFKWGSAAQQYIYNWSTKGILSGYWYKLSAKLDDGKTYSVVVGLR